MRSRVRDGRIAGKSCYGYRLERKSDGSGRKYTLAIVNDDEAPIVRRIYAEYLEGCGLKQIVSHRVRTFGGGADRMTAYGCSRHRDRGSAVCPVTIYQSREEVETALIDHLQTYVFDEPALAMVVGQLRSEIEAQIPQRDADVAALEAELASVRVEQKRLARAVALADDVPELVTELQQRSARI